MEPLTYRQREVLRFIERSSLQGQAPTVREVAQRFGIASSTVYEVIRVLERKGYLTREEGRARGLRVRRTYGKLEVPSAARQRLVEVPILGWTTAGAPNLALQEHIGTPFVDASVVRGRDLFALRVRGDSMIGAGILDGDYAIVQPQATADDGAIVLALIDGEEATIKRLGRGRQGVTLKPENPTMEPRTYSPDRVKIQGQIVAVQRVLGASHHAGGAAR